MDAQERDAIYGLLRSFEAIEGHPLVITPAIAAVLRAAGIDGPFVETKPLPNPAKENSHEQ